MQTIPKPEPSPKQQLLISRQQISKQYKQNVSSVYQTLTDLVAFSNQLGGRVDSLLHQQEQQFFKAYKSHLASIKQQVGKLQQKIRAQEAKIKQYQNEGTIALLLKKISKLETELTNIYGANNKLETELQEKRVGYQILKGDNERLMENVKRIMKMRVQNRARTISTPNYHEQSCSIQIQNTNSNSKQLQQRFLFPTEVEKQQPLISPVKPKSLMKSPTNKTISHSQNQILRNRILSLQTQHNKLLKKTVQISTLHSQLEGFFLQCIETVKKEICLRKQVPKCGLGDFRKQDKIHVLNLVLENDEIVRYVYNKLFGGLGDINKKSQQKINKRESKSNSKVRLNDSLENQMMTIDHKNQGPRKYKPSLYKRRPHNQSDGITLPKIKNKTIQHILSHS